MRQRENIKLNDVITECTDEWYDTILYTANSKIYNPSLYIKSWKSRLRNILLNIYNYTLLFTPNRRHLDPFLISNAYVDVSLSIERNIFLPPWSASIKKKKITSFRIFRTVLKIQKTIRNRSVHQLFSKDFISLCEVYKTEFVSFVKRKNVSALIVSNDLAFFENISIKSCREIGVPTFVYLHGLPARYNNIDDNRADYLIVWANGIKDLYIKAGIKKEKIITIKHPKYSNFKKQELKSSLDTVLVLTKAVSLTPSCSNVFINPDIKTSLIYLDNLKLILQELNVKSVRLRLHPSECRSVYNEIDKDFFILDTLPLEESLKKTSLVIGPSSTVLLDAITLKVNYILYEPSVEFNSSRLGLDGLEIVEPFDGKSFIRLSETVQDFKSNILTPSSNIDYEKLNEFFSVDINDADRLRSLL